VKCYEDSDKLRMNRFNMHAIPDLYHTNPMMLSSLPTKQLSELCVPSLQNKRGDI
jgi:hypothetical protein